MAARIAQVFHEPDESFALDIQRSRSGAYLLLTIASMSASEVRYLAGRSA